MEGDFHGGKGRSGGEGEDRGALKKNEEHEEGDDSCSHTLFDKVTDRTVQTRVTAFVVVEKGGREGSEDEEGNQQRNVFSFHF